MADTHASFASSSWFALLFEAESIQPFIFATNRLRDAAGGSELLDSLTNADTPGNLLDAVLQATQVKEHVTFSRRAGGAFYAFSQDPDALQRFADLWVSAVRRWAPNLDSVLAWGEDASVK